MATGTDPDTAQSGLEPWLTGLYEPVDDELDVTGLQVTGELPAALHGTYLRNGPNPAFPPLGRYHIFDGDGMLHGVTFDEGDARYRNRWVRSRGLEAERRAGRALYSGLSDYRIPEPEVVAEAGIMKNTANTHVVRHAGRILALMEGVPPTEITPDLDTVGEYDFGGALAGAMTAHPKLDPVTGEMVFFGYSPFPPHLHVYAAAPDGTITWSTPVDLPGPVMMHDFVVTATKVVMFDLPAVFDIQSMLGGAAAPEGGGFIRWAPDHGARIGVLDRGAAGATTRWVDVDPFWVFHFLNGYDDGDAVVVEGCRADALNVSFGDTEPEGTATALHRWRIDAGTGTVAVEQVDDRPADFPRVADGAAGLHARYGYLAEARAWDGDEVTFGGVAKHDLHTGAKTAVEWRAGEAGGEPVFAADPDRPAATHGEDAGWLLCFVSDKATRATDLVVVDAPSMTEVARVHMPRRVPFGFHGSWLPAGRG
ncbi:MAG TPA: carotenoid oxygenase family protein [Acidimicrobiales bacterium]|nr:carotenoid oxygenase family protein [Acidimicrobiales bacterium]